MANTILDILSKPKGHLFDLDGTLIDNEYFALRQIQEIIEQELKISNDNRLDSNYVVRRAGRPKAEIIREYAHETHISITTAFADAVEDKIKDARLRVENETDFSLTKGVQHYLQHLESQEKGLSIVTSSERPRAKLHIRHTGLTPYFDKARIISCETDIGANYVKPHPAGYQQMLNRTATDGKDAQAYEDSASGVRAAQDAGIRSIIGIVGGRHILDKDAHAQMLLDVGASLVIDNFEQLFEKDAQIVDRRLITPSQG